MMKLKFVAKRRNLEPRLLLPLFFARLSMVTPVMTPMTTTTTTTTTTMETVVMERFLKPVPLLVRASFACACAYWYKKK